MVPFVPSAQPQIQHGRQARMHAQRSFAAFLRSGGRINHMHVGSMPAAPECDEEKQSLLSDQKKLATPRLTCCELLSYIAAFMTAFIIAVIPSIATLVIFALVAHRANNALTEMRATLEPHKDEIVDSAVTMLHDMGDTWSSMHDISEELAHQTGGATGSAVKAINSSAIIAEKLAEFMQHPNIQISLGG